MLAFRIVDIRGGALAAKLVKLFLAEMKLPRGVHVLFQNTRPWECALLDEDMLDALRQAGFLVTISESNTPLLRPPHGSCFFVLSSSFSRIHKYALSVLLEALNSSDFRLGRRFNFP